METASSSKLSQKTKNEVIKSKCISSNSKELLNITGDGSRKAVIQSLMKKPKPCEKQTQPQTFKVARSPLFDQLESFLPRLKESTCDLMQKTDEEREEMNIENVEGCRQVVEMNVLLGEVTKSPSSDTDSSDDEGPTTITASNLKLPNAEDLKRQNTQLKPLIAEMKDVPVEEKEREHSPSSTQSEGSR